jgi:hypothetical protein
MSVWKMEVAMILTRRRLLESNLESAYALIEGQCSKPILEKVEAQEGHGVAKADCDPIKLLSLLKGVMFNYNSRKFRAVAIFEQTSMIAQSRHMTLSEYREKFRNQLDVLKAAGGEVCMHPGMVDDELRLAGVKVVATAKVSERADARTAAREKYEATMFLVKSDQGRYGALIQELANDFNKGKDTYPRSLGEAYELMLHDVRDQDKKYRSHGEPGMAFSTVGEDKGVPASNSQPNPRPDVVCFKCGKTGHFSNNCLETKHANGTALAVVAEVTPLRGPE